MGPNQYSVREVKSAARRMEKRTSEAEKDWHLTRGGLRPRLTSFTKTVVDWWDMSMIDYSQLGLVIMDPINEPRTIMYVKEVWTKSHPERETIIYVISTE
ncbi:uncharacterized protein N7506_010885 [Penicillium brevicompactum]|uniref:uncharacterized protein n=1 Tax=Penicillium brevicompactum TaxID=5074 RepID=UPI002540F950|nr:uncharacterized protein N7506_010885 [Penicillium brevicompactum]KAJ5321755.1 hypothetical protein N7506_010885 [Penicillium brevicompactum]